MQRTAIVILNYEAYQETETCIDSILGKRLDVTGILVVDNGSKNDSYQHLKQKYEKNTQIKVIKSHKNLGFAKGNNLGIKVAKAIWKVNFILLLNSDTIMIEEDYLEKLFCAYEKGVGVIQTSALRLNGRYTQKNYGNYQLYGLLLDTIKEWCFYHNIYFPDKPGKWRGKKVGPWISGCDIFLTEDYFKVFQGLYPLTFLYGEEYLLAIMLKKAKLEWKLVENAHIVHAESRSTPDNFKEGTRKKQNMMLKTKRHIWLVKLLPLKRLQGIINYGKW